MPVIEQRRNIRTSLLLLGALALVPRGIEGQTLDDRSAELMSELTSAPIPKVPPPPIVFEVVATVSIPGPLDGPGPRGEPVGVGVHAAGGLVVVAWDAAGSLSEDVRGPIDSGPPAIEAVGLSPDGRARARFLGNGQLVVETACRRCSDGWNRKFRLRLPGTGSAAPVVTDRRVIFAGRDNVVYCIRRDNGHRVWDHVAEGRVGPPLVLWTGRPEGIDPREDPAPDPVSLVLAVTDEPSSVVALDARTGEQVCSFDVGAEKTLVGAPLVLEDGRLVVARQDYRSTTAALVVLRPTWREPEAASR